jgi:hypothetical protein
MLGPLPETIQSISNTRWVTQIRWVTVENVAMAEIDHDWRIWVHLQTGKCTVRNKGVLKGTEYGSLAEGLASLDYKEFRNGR